MILRTGLFIMFTLLVGCDSATPISYLPMPMPKTDGPWQVMTINEQRIYREQIKLVDGRLVKINQPVYVAQNGQFVFKEGSPIKAFSQDLYWNSQGKIISNQRIEFKPSAIFKVNGKPMQDQSGMILRQVLQAGRADWQKQVSQLDS